MTIVICFIYHSLSFCFVKEMLKIPEYFKIEINTNMAEYQNIDITSLFDISQEIVKIIKSNYLKEGISPQGKLANFKWTVAYNNNLYQLQLMLPPEWKWVELGRRPSTKMPPVNAIENWIHVKQLVPQGKNGKVPTTKQMAFAIAKKIQKEGFYSPNHQGKHVVEKSLQEAEPIIVQLCNIITKKFNNEIDTEIVSVFDGLNCIKTK